MLPIFPFLFPGSLYKRTVHYLLFSLLQLQYRLLHLILQADAKTIRFRDKVLKQGGVWRDIYGIDEKKVASMVREDKVDILVELTGHTANNKLGMMACRPAPVQVC